MRKIDIRVISPVAAGGYQKGDPVDGASVTIYFAGTVVLATLYADEALTPLTNPLLTDANGQAAAYVRDGAHDLKVFKSGVVDYTHLNVPIVDPQQGVEVTINDEVWYGVLNAKYNRNLAQWNRRDTSKDAWGIKGQRSDLGPTLMKVAAGANPIGAWSLIGRLGTPVAAIVPFAGRTAPTGWLFCDGAAISRTTYADLFDQVTFTRSGTLTSASAVVTGLSQTSDLRVGMGLTGTGVPVGTTIASIDSASQITMSALATATGAQTLTFYLYGAGDGSTTFNVPDLRSRFPVGMGQGAGLTNRVLAAAGGEEAHALTIAELAAHTHSDTSIVAGTGGAQMVNGTDWHEIISNSGSTGSGTAHNTMPPFLVLNYIIKA